MKEEGIIQFKDQIRSKINYHGYYMRNLRYAIVSWSDSPWAEESLNSNRNVRAITGRRCILSVPPLQPPLHRLYHQSCFIVITKLLQFFRIRYLCRPEFGVNEVSVYSGLHTLYLTDVRLPLQLSITTALTRTPHLVRQVSDSAEDHAQEGALVEVASVLGPGV